MIGNWDETNCEWALAFHAWGKGNGTSDKNSGEFPTYPDGDDNWTLIDMTSGEGYLYDGGNSICDFDGVANNVEASSLSIPFTNTSKHTWEFILYFGGGTGTYSMAFHKNAGGDVLQLRVHLKKIQFRIWASGAWRGEFMQNINIETGWHTIHLIKDGSDMKAYIDGSAVAGSKVAYSAGNVTLDGGGWVGEQNGANFWPYQMYWAAYYSDAIATSRIDANMASLKRWYAITYGGGKFVAVAINGTGNRVLTSSNGIKWVEMSSAADNYWTDVCYGNGLFVAVANTGSGNRVMTSSDGITWTLRTSAADLSWRSVCYGNGTYVAVAFTGTGNRVMTSTDGITWTSRTSAADNEWYQVCYGNSLFVAVSRTGTGNRVMTSPDGTTWTIRTSAGDKDWRSVCYGNGLFVACAFSDGGTGQTIMTSSDGITWTLRTSAADKDWRSIIYGDSLYVCCGFMDSGNGQIVQTSTDGITWTLRTAAANHDWSEIAYGGGTYACCATDGLDGRIMTSTDGINWTIRFVPFGAICDLIGNDDGGDVMALTAPGGVGNLINGGLINKSLIGGRLVA